MLGEACYQSWQAASGRAGDRTSGPVTRYIVELPLLDRTFVPGKPGWQRAHDRLKYWNEIRGGQGWLMPAHEGGVIFRVGIDETPLGAIYRGLGDGGKGTPCCLDDCFARCQRVFREQGLRYEQACFDDAAYELNGLDWVRRRTRSGQVGNYAPC